MIAVCELIRMSYKKDEQKNLIPIECAREVICDETSTQSKEWHQAKMGGLSPSFTLKTARINYEGEKILRYNGKKYSIYRTYVVGDDIELYCEEEAGNR
ncbi:MAG: hypothetical protein MJ134_07730 [Lachnospiraceae bacterium]|nr:hypothetical protein [Lachnospiraceae bacterium]